MATPPAVAANEYLDAVGVVFGVATAPGYWGGAEGGAHYGYYELKSQSQSQSFAAIVTPSAANPCVLDVVKALIDTKGGSVLFHSVVDLSKVRAMKVHGGALVVIEGTDFICTREIGLPIPASAVTPGLPAGRRHACTSAEFLDVGKEEHRRATLAALSVIAKTCRLPAPEP